MPESLHIAMVVRSFSTGGGLELYVHKVIEGLLARGVKVTVVCQESKSDLNHPQLNVETFAAPGKRLPKWRKLDHQFTAASSAIKRSGPFDLVHTQHFPVDEADIVTFHNHSVPYIATVGTGWENALNAAKALLVPAYHRRDYYDRLLCRRALSFIVPSEICRQDFIRAYGSIMPIERTPYVVAHPGADLADNEPTSVSSSPAESSSNEPFKFLFVGRGYRRKGLDTVLKACSILNKKGHNSKLLVAGLSEKVIDSIRLAVLGLTHRVVYLGFRTDMDAVYKKAKVFVMPSRHDVFGMAPLQAMHHGLVPIVSKSMGVSELLSDRHNALILEDHLDASALSKLMEELIVDPGLLESLQSQVKQVAAATTWDKCVDATIDAYRLATEARAANKLSEGRSTGERS